MRVMDVDTLLRLKSFWRGRLRSAFDTRTARRDSAAIRRRLADLPLFQRATTVALYRPRPGEVDTTALAADLLAAGRCPVVPVADPVKRTLHFVAWPATPSAWRRGAHGIEEPAAGESVPAESIDLLVVPGVAYTAGGERLGAGGGYYDRFLARHPGLVTVGLAFEENLRAWLPLGDLDRPVDVVVTPRRVFLRQKSTSSRKCLLDPGQQARRDDGSLQPARRKHGLGNRP